MLDVVIIGGGPAGLSAALLLGRCLRKVLVCDAGNPRNAVSASIHGFLTREGTPPLELRRLARHELGRYSTVSIQDIEVVDVVRMDRRFEVVLSNRSRVETRIVLFATGRRDKIPDLPGFREFYGRGVYHCPACDGWEHRDQEMAVYGEDADSVEIALELKTWTRAVTLCWNAKNPATRAQRERLAANDIEFVATPVRRLEGDAQGRLQAIAFEDGTLLACQALFFSSECNQQSELAEKLGCELDESGSVVCEKQAATRVPGVYVAGNVRGGVHLAIVAAAEGAEAALAINDALLSADERSFEDTRGSFRKKAS